MKDSYTVRPSDAEMSRLATQAEQLYGGFSYLTPFLPKRPGARVLDVGCGSANLAAHIASLLEGGSVTGIDRDAARIALARESYSGVDGMDFQVGEATRLPFPDNSFDLTHSRFVLMHVPNPKKALAEMVRVTRPGGAVVLHEGFHDAIWLSPQLPAFDRLVSTWRRVMEEQEQDHSVGIRSFEYLSGLGLENLSSEVITSHATSGDGKFHRYIDNWIQLLPGLRDSLAGRVPEWTFASLAKNLASLDGPGTYLELTVVTAGRKRP